MKMWLISFFCFALACQTTQAQNAEKIVVNPKDSTSGYYLAVKPPAAIKGVLVLLDGFAGSPEAVMVESHLPQAAFANGFLTVCAAMGEKIYADSVVIGRMNRILEDVKQRYRVPANQFVIGGFSAGGTISLRYAELCKEAPSRYPANPAAVFAVDSPVDLIDLWRFFEKQIAKNYSDVAVNEARFVSALMKREHGTPNENLVKYRWLTPFYFEEKGEGNERFLKDIPVRVYHDVDIVWQLQNRRRSVHEANYLNTSELILRLLQMQNTGAEFVVGRTGYRINGMRHPHSWNIVDEIEFIQWMKKILEQ